jgi:hypothetical protein
MAQIPDLHGLKRVAAGLLHGGDGRAFVDDGLIDNGRIVNDGGAVDDCRIID